MTGNQRKTFLQLTFGAPDKLALPFWKASPGEWTFKYGNSIEDLDLDEKTLKTDLVYLKMAEIWGTNSHCKRMQVGCLMVKNKSIISDGYNGSPSGFPNQCEDDSNTTLPYVLHAEANAITKLARSSESGENAVAFITHQPCLECSKLLYQTGISEVYYVHEYRVKEGVEFLTKCKIKLHRMKDEYFIKL